VSRTFRDATLALAPTEPFARRMINSGRLSTPARYEGSPLNGPDGFAAGEAQAAGPGAAALDAPIDGGWLLDRLGQGFTALWLGRNGPRQEAACVESELGASGLPARTATIGPGHQLACRRYGAEAAPALYLFRPDGHVAARWRTLRRGDVTAALARASGRTIGAATG
jgi:3-(3-hydroxy-phenyl)propionate hydroxylase